MRVNHTLTILLAGLGAGCFPSVDADKADLEGHQDWFQVEATGAIPDHGDTYRIIYVNDAALEYGGAGEYPLGSVLVKEVHSLDSGGGPGRLDYIAVMRKLEEAPPGGELDGGWLFTFLDDGIDGEELYVDSCWSTCHVAAPRDGAFLRYGL